MEKEVAFDYDAVFDVDDYMYFYSEFLIDYRHADMRDLDLEGEFDLVLMVFTVFGYFTDEVNLRVLENAARALKPGGRLVIDSPNRDVVMKDFHSHHVTEKEGNLMIDRNHFDSITGRLYNRRIVIREGIRRDKPFFVRLYNPSEIRGLLNKVGLVLETLLGGYDGQPVSPDARRMVVVAQKP